MKDDAGHWRYLRDPGFADAQLAKDYLATMDFIFETYASLVEPMKKYFGSLKTIEDAEYDINGDGTKEKLRDLIEEKDKKAFRITYNFDVRTKSCDTLRCLLPLSTLTNLGMFGNGRFYQHLISHLFTSAIAEAGDIGKKTLIATSEVIPQYVRRAKRSDYLASVRSEMFALASELFAASEPEIPQQLPAIHLLDDLEVFDDQVVAAMLFPYLNLSLSSIRQRAGRLDRSAKQRIIDTYVNKRTNRRDRPGRALEEGYSNTFELVTNWGVYKDLMRHRMNTQQRQLFTTKLGFDLPLELKKAGFESQVLACVKRADALFDQIASSDALLAQYAVLHGHYARWTLSMNDREAMHMLELRSTPQGHPQYRRVVQEMHRLISARSPWRGEAMKFADYNEYYWSRADSEARQRVEERILEEKFTKEIQ